MFELGARWGAKLFLAPLLAGVEAGELTSPLGQLNALSANSEAQLHQFLDNISDRLGLRLQAAASYVRYIATAKNLADATISTDPITPRPVAAFPIIQSVGMKLTVEGKPPAQKLKLEADRRIIVLRLAYMLSDRTCIASEDVSMEGKTIELPIDDEVTTVVWNTERHDASQSDGSGPAKLGVVLSVDGETEDIYFPCI